MKILHNHNVDVLDTILYLLQPLLNSNLIRKRTIKPTMVAVVVQSDPCNRRKEFGGSCEYHSDKDHKEAIVGTHHHHHHHNHHHHCHRHRHRSATSSTTSSTTGRRRMMLCYITIITMAILSSPSEAFLITSPSATGTGTRTTTTTHTKRHALTTTTIQKQVSSTNNARATCSRLRKMAIPMKNNNNSYENELNVNVNVNANVNVNGSTDGIVLKSTFLNDRASLLESAFDAMDDKDKYDAVLTGLCSKILDGKGQGQGQDATNTNTNMNIVDDIASDATLTPSQLAMKRMNDPIVLLEEMNGRKVKASSRSLMALIDVSTYNTNTNTKTHTHTHANICNYQ